MGPGVPNSWTFLITCSVPVFASLPQLLSKPHNLIHLSPKKKSCHIRKLPPFWLRVLLPSCHSPPCPLCPLPLSLFLSFPGLPARQPQHGCSVSPSPKTLYPSSLLDLLTKGRVFAFTFLLPGEILYAHTHTCARVGACTTVVFSRLFVL